MYGASGGTCLDPSESSLEGRVPRTKCHYPGVVIARGDR
jgi:hypothetical protein